MFPVETADNKQLATQRWEEVRLAPKTGPLDNLCIMEQITEPVEVQFNGNGKASPQDCMAIGL